MAAARPAGGDSQKRLGELLVELGFIDEGQLQTALARQRQWGKRLGWVLVESGFITEARLVRGLSRQLKLDTCDPITAPVHDRVRAMIPRDMALSFRVVPIAVRRGEEGDEIFVATADPLNLQTQDSLQARTSMQVRFLLAGETEIELALARHYGTRPPSFMPDDPISGSAPARASMAADGTITLDGPEDPESAAALASIVQAALEMPDATVAMATGEPEPFAPDGFHGGVTRSAADAWPAEDVTMSDFDPPEFAKFELDESRTSAGSVRAESPISGLPPPHVAQSPGPIFGGSAASASPPPPDKNNWADMFPGSNEHSLPPRIEAARPSSSSPLTPLPSESVPPAPDGSAARAAPAPAGQSAEAPQAPGPATQASSAAPPTSAAPAPASSTPAPTTPARSESSSPAAPASASPIPSTTPPSVTSAPPTSAPTTPRPVASAPPTSAPTTPRPVTSAAPASASAIPSTTPPPVPSAPPTSAPTTPRPVPSAPPTSAPTTPRPVTSAAPASASAIPSATPPPVPSAPPTSAPTTPRPVTSARPTSAPTTPRPVTSAAPASASAIPSATPPPAASAPTTPQPVPSAPPASGSAATGAPSPPAAASPAVDAPAAPTAAPASDSPGSAPSPAHAGLVDEQAPPAAAPTAAEATPPATADAEPPAPTPASPLPTSVEIPIMDLEGAAAILAEHGDEAPAIPGAGGGDESADVLSIDVDLDAEDTPPPEMIVESVAQRPPPSGALIELGPEAIAARVALERFVTGAPLDESTGLWVARLIGAIFLEEGLFEDERLERAVARVGPLKEK